MIEQHYRGQCLFPLSGSQHISKRKQDRCRTYFRDKDMSKVIAKKKKKKTIVVKAFS